MTAKTATRGTKKAKTKTKNNRCNSDYQRINVSTSIVFLKTDLYSFVFRSLIFDLTPNFKKQRAKPVEMGITTAAKSEG